MLPYVAEHFTDRLPMENFIIYDKTHRIAAIHKASKNFILSDTADLDFDKITRYSDKESEYRGLWLTFFDHIAVKARTNPSLQMQLMPKRYWANTPEMSRFYREKYT